MADDKCRMAGNDLPFEARSISRFSNAFSGASSAVSEPVASQTSPAPAGETEHAPRRPRSDATGAGAHASADRRWGELLWYRLVQYMFATMFAALGGWRASGRHNMPASGAVLLVANHLSFLDVFLLGITLRRPLNFVARSSLFFPVLGYLIRSMGAFPIQREGMGASGMKETLRRLRRGGIVTLFPEGTRSRDGKLAPLKSGIAVLVSRAGVPVVPAGIAGTFEAWPRSRLLPVLRPVRIHFGPPIRPEDIAGMESQAVTALIRDRLQDCVRVAQEGLARDLNQ
jgi:1-acyl-sn-glycerol-3-phosphate acyltransferase